MGHSERARQRPPRGPRLERAERIERVERAERGDAASLSSRADGDPRPFPLVLQQRAGGVVRQHMARGLMRVFVLLAGDVAVLAVLRAIVRSVGDAGALGSPAAALTRALVPRGTFPAAQLIVAVVIGLWLFGTYRAGDRRRDAARLFAGSSLGLALVLWAPLWNGLSVLHVIGLAAVAVVLATLITLVRTVVDVAVQWARPTSTTAPRALIVGTPAHAREAARNPAVSDPVEFNLLGFVDVAARPHADALGSAVDLVSIVERHAVDTVVLSGHIDDDVFRRVVDLADAAGCHVFCLPREFTLRGFEPTLVWHRGEPLVQITQPGLRGQQMLVKRGLDLVLSVAGLVLLSPLFALTALAVRLSSRGPIFFRQERVGRGGRRFQIVKFRSMVPDAEGARAGLDGESVYGDARLFKMRNDPRRTTVGRFLRRTSLDELPQLWNVLRGDMSLVGPRPPVPSEVAYYEDRHFTRFDMKPGITGPWQVSGRNNITCFEEVVRLEEQYIRHWSIWKDVAILLRTVPAVLRMDGAH